MARRARLDARQAEPSCLVRSQAGDQAEVVGILAERRADRRPAAHLAMSDRLRRERELRQRGLRTVSTLETPGASNQLVL